MNNSGSRGFFSRLFGRSSTPAAPTSSSKVFLEVSAEGDKVGRMEFALYDKDCPKTCENFRKLCTGENRQKYTYKGSFFHRIINGFMAQGGDFTNHNGTGGVSIFGRKFPDENLTLQHTKRGMLSMANAGPNTNGSQFFILFAPAPWLDGKHVVFGEMTDGEQVLSALEKSGTQSGQPLYRFKIEDCGEVKKEDVE
ncbi:unnamed protein product [Moneuplotes crassus]|uniref:Peptidyl-prolyl cis-trans isomerase n=2 Tax=Euplotes crassus TaxID=5936 RepID=A0AAD1XZ07_EUPCR|nr:unnamed protein product [Moneuplotes crassus]